MGPPLTILTNLKWSAVSCTNCNRYVRSIFLGKSSDLNCGKVGRIIGYDDDRPPGIRPYNSRRTDRVGFGELSMKTEQPTSTAIPKR